MFDTGLDLYAHRENGYPHPTELKFVFHGGKTKAYMDILAAILIRPGVKGRSAILTLLGTLVSIFVVYTE
ncbi:hypothetical protein [Agaribacter flavus]|uniref:Uncharacterized protein n=1 Tax=Agaribacter flavus TaxID=1902781 RepID=A0ABV7FQ52_9ALTE